ncbi:hypothetical protein QFC22_000810 [Naganishia vaughanmartiniae]|uniref:Uncharacterized protein n=1 Tax=Naganishia vaughanmartiniae TaxID=1424756 RepID=A0ACC2XJI3_9TREE|nr:hypothetical protein QFC22_000810 [Naganishia vaughanmartiniae]
MLPGSQSRQTGQSHIELAHYHQTTPISMSTSQDVLPFQFVPSISLEAYRKLWSKTLKETKAKVTELERPRSEDDIKGYLDELDALDYVRRKVDITGGVWQSMHPDAEFRKEGAAAKTAFTSLNAEVATSAAIAANLAKFEKAVPDLEDDDAKRLLSEWKRDLRRGGAFLAAEERQKVYELSTQIQTTQDLYLDNIRNDQGKLELDVEELAGVPDDFFTTHPADAVTGKITLAQKAADTHPVTQYCKVQDTREKVMLFRCSAAASVNGPVLQRLLGLRAQKAKLLGYKTWADYQLEVNMVKTATGATTFLEDVHDAVKPRAQREKTEIAKLLKEKDGVDVQSWDMVYGESLLKSHLLDGFDIKATRQYFIVNRVFPALLRIVERLFSLRFEELPHVEAWYPSITACRVYDTVDGDDRLIGRLFFDLYPREGKLDGASAWGVRAPIPGKQMAEVILFANMPEQPTACMSYLEVKTLLHELGHCVHTLVSPSRFAQFAGIGTCQRDFVESPSQMLELWLTDYRLFDFAVNDKGEIIPAQVLKQLIAADSVGRGLAHQRQLVLAKYALELHTTDLNSEEAIFDVVAETGKKYGAFPIDAAQSIHLGFPHMSLPAYASAYYCYLFAEVICHDLFQEFQKGGNIMDRDVAARYRKIVLQGVGSHDADDVVTAFLGRKFNSKAFKNWLNESV